MSLYHNFLPFKVKILNPFFTYPGENSLTALINFDLDFRPKIRLKVLDAYVIIPNWGREKYYLNKQKSFSQLIRENPFESNHTVMINNIQVSVDISNSDGDGDGDGDKSFEAHIADIDVYIYIQVDNGWRRNKKTKFRLLKEKNNAKA